MAWQLENTASEWQLEDDNQAPASTSTAVYPDTKLDDWGRTFLSETKNVVKGYGDIAINPISVVESGAQILSEGPSFIAGVLGAVQNGVRAILSGADLEDIYAEMRDGFQRDYHTTSEYLVPYKPKYAAKESEQVTQTVMAPALAVMHIANHMANSKDLEGHPNIQAAVRLAGDIGGLALQGKTHAMMKTKPLDLPKPTAADLAIDTTKSKSEIINRVIKERVSVQQRPLTKLANIEKRLAGDTPARRSARAFTEDLGEFPESTAKASAGVFDRLSAEDPTMTPAERSAQVFAQRIAENQSEIGRRGLAERLASQQAATRPEFEAIRQRNIRDAEIARQAALVDEKVGPREPGGKQIKLPVRTASDIELPDEYPYFWDEAANQINTGNIGEDALKFLTVGEGFEEISSELRSGRPPDYLADMVRAFDSRQPYIGTVYRGIEFDTIGERDSYINNLTVGDVITDKSFLFSSKYSGVAKDYANIRTGHGVVFKIRSKTGRDLGDISENPREAAVVFKPGAELRVVKIGDEISTGADNKARLVELEDVTPSKSELPGTYVEQVERRQIVSAPGQYGFADQRSPTRQYKGVIEPERRITQRRQQRPTLPEWMKKSVADWKREIVEDYGEDALDPKTPAEAMGFYVNVPGSEHLINSAARYDIVDPQASKIIDLLDEQLVNSRPYVGTVYRGIDILSRDPKIVDRFLSDVESKKSVSDLGYLSASSDNLVAETYGDIMLEIESKTGRWVEDFNEAWSDESHVMFPRNTEFEVVGVDRSGYNGQPLIRLREVTPGGESVRSFTEILRDVGALMPKPNPNTLGSIAAQFSKFTPEQKAAYNRIRNDLSIIKRNAARTGKEVGDYLRDLGTDPAVIDLLLANEKGIRVGLPIVDPTIVEKELGVKYNGVWEFPPEMNKSPMHTWTDRTTGSTFTSESMFDVRDKLAVSRRQFGVEEPGQPSSSRSAGTKPVRPGILDPNATVESLVAEAEAALRRSNRTETLDVRSPNTPIEDVVRSFEAGPASASFLHKLTRTKEGLSEALNSPEVVFKRDKSGTGTKIYKLIDRADQRGNAFVYKQGKELSDVIKGIKPGRESDLRIGAALDGKMPRSELSLRERRAYDFLRSKFDYLLDRYIRTSTTSEDIYRQIIRRANSGRPVDTTWVESLSPTDRFAWDLMNRRVSDYLPHIFDRDSLLAEFKSERAKLASSPDARNAARRIRQIDDAINTMQGGGLITYEALPRTLRMRFFEPRRGKEGYNLSAIRAYSAYLNGIRRKIYDEPAVRQVAELHKRLDPSLREYNKWYVRRYLGWDKNKLDDLAGAIASFQWMRTLGLNPRSAVVNLTQRINTIAEAGLKYSIQGQKDAFTKEGNKLFDSTGIAREIPQVLMEGSAPASMERVRSILGYLFNKVELGNRKHAFLAGRRKALAAGRTSSEAYQAGIDMAHKTQFRYGRVGMPKVLSHPVGRIGLQFWSYPIKQLELITDWAKNDPKKLLAYVAMAEGGKKTLQELLNVDLSNALGFGLNLGQAIHALRDIPEGDWRGFWRHLRIAATEGGGMLPSGPGPTASGLYSIITGMSEGEGMRAVKKELSPILVNRAVQAYKAVVNKNENNLYPIYGRNKQLMYYLTGKQLLMRSVGPKSYTESKQYVEYREQYLLNQEQQLILRDVTRAIVDGDNKKANKLINKYGVVPSEQMIANEVLRRELPSETRRVINKTKRQWEFEAIREPED